jgi:ATP-dependent RNA helicase RhlE
MRAGISVAALHGAKSQGARETALRAFKKGANRVLVATDIASRGIDITQLPFVVNFDLPDSPETYVHRIGRTGRADFSGDAITLQTPDEERDMRQIEKIIKMRVPVVKDHPFASN